MRHLRTWTCFAAFILLTLPAGADDHRGMLWRVSDTADNAAFLVGTVHAASPDFYPLPAHIEDALDASEVLVLEVDPSGMSQAEINHIVMTHGHYTPPHSLQRALPGESWRLATDWAGSHDIPRRRLDRMRPWLAALTLVSLEMQRLGFDPELGMERHFVRRAATSGIGIAELETMAEQIGSLSGLPQEVQLRFLVETLKEREDITGTATRILDIWRAGDLDALTRLLDETYADEPEVYEALMRQRNLRWLPGIESMLTSGQVHFIAVGALHMAGPDGLVKLLEAKGYRVVQK